MGSTPTLVGSIFYQRSLYTSIGGVILVTSNFETVARTMTTKLIDCVCLIFGFYFLILPFLLFLKCTPMHAQYSESRQSLISHFIQKFIGLLELEEKFLAMEFITKEFIMRAL